jgi:NAD(P)-dependent dehydrogenase (short-subunit alcohol dehydrogenase family)
MVDGAVQGSRVMITGLAGVPMERAAALAGPVLYLSSPAAGYTTGEALRLDGGADVGQAGRHR